MQVNNKLPKLSLVTPLLTVLLLFGSGVALCQSTEIASLKGQADELYSAGNYREALTLYEKLLATPAADNRNDDRHFASILDYAVRCIAQLNIYQRFDDLVDKAVASHEDNRALLLAAGQQYLSTQHQGYLIGGEFERGYNTGKGRFVNTYERDRVRALQLHQQAWTLLQADTAADNNDRFNLLSSYANAVLGQHYRQSWRLQLLTEFNTLPDYDDNYGSNNYLGAPVDDDGEIITYSIPDSFAAASNDGERWRFLLREAELTGINSQYGRWQWAQFLWQEYGVQTVAASLNRYYYYRQNQPDSEQAESSLLELSDLADEETIARLANGVKRFNLPDDYRFIDQFKTLAEDDGYQTMALSKLAEIYENRRQRNKAADYWRQALATKRGDTNNIQARLDQIVGAWAQFEPLPVQAEQDVDKTVNLRFRNATSVKLTAYRIRTAEYLSELKKHLNANPDNIAWEKINLPGIGYYLLTSGSQYRGRALRTWVQTLTPAPDHEDKHQAVTLPNDIRGAYLLEASVNGGNTAYIVVWNTNAVIVSRPMEDATFYYLANATTGQPLGNQALHFFGYQTQWRERKPAQLFDRNKREMEVITREFDLKTDARGQLIVAQKQLSPEFQWLVHTDESENDFAFLNAQRIWYGRGDYWENQPTKAFILSNQPVYRPGQTVELKAWVGTASYTPDRQNPHANQRYQLRIHDPFGKEIVSTEVTADAYGGITYTLPLTDSADLGVYGINIAGVNGYGNFRVEEYKKPEFEVAIDKPTQPLRLGETIRATVNARYYFGAPVSNATVKVKVLRYEHNAQWFPQGPWDWLYGRGYWWYACDMAWLPGWRDWGTSAPRASWLPYYPPEPELVMETELPIAADGTAEIAIDTRMANLLHGDKDHRYNIAVEVVDQSRRSVYADGDVLVARKPFAVYAWVDQGFYQLGDSVTAYFRAQTIANLPIQGEGRLDLLRIHYDSDNKPVETVVQTWPMATDSEGNAEIRLQADAVGQHRLRYQVSDDQGNEEAGGYVFNVIGDADNVIATGDDRFRFNELELIPNQAHYTPGDTLQLLINSQQKNANVLLFERPHGAYPRPVNLRLNANSQLQEIAITKGDYPNFFVEAVTVFNGKVYSQVKEIPVPPPQTALNVSVNVDEQTYKPGDTAEVEISLTDQNGDPFIGSSVITVYDKALDYIAGDIGLQNIQEYFWQWKRQHTPVDIDSAAWVFGSMVASNANEMRPIGVFGDRVLPPQDGEQLEEVVVTASLAAGDSRMRREVMSAAAPAPALEADNFTGVANRQAGSNSVSNQTDIEVRREFADAIFWNGNIETNADGKAKVTFTLPDNLTTWKTSVWSMGQNTQVGQSSTEFVTNKDLLLRLQAPRFFIEKDEVVLSANVHNYLDSAQAVAVKLELDGKALQLLADNREQRVRIDANGEQRVDWRVQVASEGMATVRMLAISDAESDAVEMSLPVYVHGQLITHSFSGALNKEQRQGAIEFTIPPQRRPQQSRLELRYSPTLAGAMVDALPYLVDYPYGCTEQTLNRFLPTVLVNKVLTTTGIDMAAIRDKQSNLNAQEIGDDRERAAQWGNIDEWRWRFKQKNPVFDNDEVKAMAATGLLRLSNMQLSDGGWGWFSGWGESSSAHTTAQVVRGLLLAKAGGMPSNESSLQRGIDWLQYYQQQELQKLNNAATKTQPYKTQADNIDALVAMVLADADLFEARMLEQLFNDRTSLSVYGQTLLALALHSGDRVSQRDQVRRNIEQYLVRDPENQTAYLNLHNNNYWWYWYGSEFEAQAYYLKLLAAIDPNGDIAPALVKYLLNNRKHANYWNSTRDTALVIEAMADYLSASGEAEPNLTVDVLLDGKIVKTLALNQDNLFDFDNKLVLEGLQLATGKHTLQLQKRGEGPLYYNAYLSNFSLEDNLRSAGLEIKVERQYYKLTPSAADDAVATSRGQAVQQAVEKYTRTPITNDAELQSGDLVEIELVIDSKNDYEYIIIEDMKAAGFEPLAVRSGYDGNELGAYVEYRDNRVAFFVHRLERGKHNLSYRMKAEIPGRFSALPTKIEAMYAPELKANSDEEKLSIVDR